MAVVSSQKEIENLQPNFAPLKRLNARGIIVTARGDEADFVSRCFFPEAGIEEDEESKKSDFVKQEASL